MLYQPAKVALGLLLAFQLACVEQHAHAASACEAAQSPLAAASPAAALEPPPVPPRSVWLRAVGDIQLGRNVEREAAEHSLADVFAGVRTQLRASDLTFGNLESVMSHACTRSSMGYHLQSHPSSVLALRDAGFDVLSLANNHANDCGSVGLAEATRRLREAGMLPVGVGDGSKTRRPPAVFVTRGGLRLAFLAYSAFDMGDSVVYATADSEGLMMKDIRRAAQQADLVVVSFHWGPEYVHEPSATQRRFAHEAVDAGADLVIGHHPHVIQGLELYRGKVVAYSLGNFIFDQTAEHTRAGLLLDWQVDERGQMRAAVLPIWIEKEPFRAEVALGSRGDEILAHTAKLSRALGSEVRVVAGWLAIAGLVPPQQLAVQP